MPEYHSGKNYTSSSSSSEISSSSASPSARMQRLKQRKQENQPKSTDPAKKQQLLASFDERVAPSEQEDNVKVTSSEHDVEVEEKQSTSQYLQPELKTPATKPESTLPKLIEQGEQAYEQQDYLSAYDLFSEVVSQQPDNPTALFHLSVSANQTGNHAVAIETTQQLMDSGHYTAQACYFQAQSLEELGRKQQAAIAYQKAGAEIPEAKNAFMRLEEERLLGGFNRQPVKSSDRDKTKTTKQTDRANAYQSPIKSAVAETSHSDVGNLTSVEKLGEAVNRGAKALPAALAEELKALFSPANAASLVAVAGVYIAAHATGIGQAMDIGMLIAGGIFFGLDAFTIFKDLAGFAGAINATTEKELDRAGEDLADAIAKIGVDAVMTLLTKKVADEIGKSVDHLNQGDEVTAGSEGANINAGNLDDADDLVSFDELKYPDGTKIKKDLPEHLRNFDGISKKGVSGTHNLDTFNQVVQSEGIQIISKTEHPTVKGIYEIKYKVPKQDGSGELRAKEWPKTVYDPAIHSDEKIVELGQKAVSQGIDEAIANSNAGFVETVEGIDFQIYLDLDTKLVRNVFPIIR